MTVGSCASIVVKESAWISESSRRSDEVIRAVEWAGFNVASNSARN